MVRHDAVVVCDTVVGRDAVVGRAVVGCAAVVGHDVENLYLNGGKPAKWVEKPRISACRKSLPKTGKTGEMVEKPISTYRKSLPKQLFLPGKGRDSKPHLPEISTQNRENRRNG